MSTRVLACPNTTVQFIRHLKPNSIHALNSSDSDLKKFIDLIKSKTVELYTPVYILPFIHHYLLVDNFEPAESCVMSEFLNISCSNLSVDYDVLLSDSLELTKKCTALDLLEAMSLLTAEALQIDFLILSNSLVHNLLDHHLEAFPNFSVPYGTVDKFLLNYIDSQQ
jgi:hypothetical protein